MGTSGVSSAQLELDLYDEHNNIADHMDDQTEVTLSCPELNFTPQKFYLSRRSVSKNVCHCVCYDKMCKTDKIFDISGINFVGDDGGTVNGQSVLNAVCAQCGFSGYGAFGSGISFYGITFKKSDLENVTCRQILEDISEVLIGVFVYGSENKLYFAALGGGEYGDVAFADEYTEISYQGKTSVVALVMVNSDTGEAYRFGDENGNGTTLEVESPLVTEDLAAGVWERVEGYVYKSWHCDKADITRNGSILNSMGALVFYRLDVPEWGDGLLGRGLFATTTEFSCDSTGIYFSGGAAPYNDWNYRSRLDREKLSVGKNVGNTEVKSNGDVVFRNLNKGGGLSGESNGISICVRNKNR